MSYALAAPLQMAVYQRLISDETLDALVGGNVFDAVPQGTLPRLYVALGAETVKDAGDATGAGAWHEFVISVVSENAGFQNAKEAAAAISDALDGADLALSRGRLVGQWFRRAKAAREGGQRRIDLTFHARVEDA
ncbi:DUF3168 domain-containing protein [Citreimonas sp.]|uniref:DUF3168 domain-containing protein n=1 Tax=Citreimonas sp. TaxID=3036715 RepID=UPI0035C829D8